MNGEEVFDYCWYDSGWMLIVVKKLVHIIYGRRGARASRFWNDAR